MKMSKSNAQIKSNSNAQGNTNSEVFRNRLNKPTDDEPNASHRLNRHRTILKIIFLIDILLFVTAIVFSHRHPEETIIDARQVIVALPEQQSYVTLPDSADGAITDKWHYSSELRVFNTQLVYRLAMALFPDNWHYARVFSVAVFLMILILSALLLVKAAKLGTAGLWWCAAVALPVGQWYGWNVIYNSYYIPHIAISMVSVALIIAYSRSAKSQTTVQQESQTAPVLLSQTAVQQQRQLLSLRGIAGVLGVCAGFASLYMLYRIIRNRKSELSQRFLFLFIGISIIICLIVYSQTSIYNCSYWIPLLPFVILALIMGVEDWISEKKPEMGVEDWLYGKKTGGDVTENHVRATDKIQTFMFGNLQTIIFAVITTVFFICSIATMQNPYISWVPNDLTIQSVADWLVENGYTQGCATFWNSDVLTELSDGKIEMWTVNEMNELDTNQWLQETSHDTQMPEGEFFIITTPDEYTQNAETWKLPALTDYLVYGDDNYFSLFSTAWKNTWGCEGSRQRSTRGKTFLHGKTR